MADKIDIVITWVDGNDKKWQESKNAYLPEENKKIDAGNVRYRDWGLLPYLLRSIEKNAPWAGNIFIVTAGQVPDFLNTDNPRIKLVFHEDFIHKDYLPTFSSRAIEFNLHKIPGLSEKFVYFNDDMLVTAMTSESDFFDGELPADMHIQNVIAPINGSMPQVQMNDMKIVNKYCSKRDFMKNNRSKWLTFKYGKNVIRNLLLKKWDYFTGFYDPHMPMSLTKNMLADLWKHEFHAVNKTCMNKFKSTDDVNIWLCRYLYLAKGEFSPRKASFGRYTELSDNNETIFGYITGKKQKVICLNDTSRCTKFEEQREKLIGVANSVFPEKSSFEKDM